MIVFTHVTKHYDGVVVLDDVSFEIQPAEFVCITGPSGAGKSTIVNLLIRAEVPTKGTIEVDGADIARLPISILQLYRQNTGVVFQDYKLLPDRTVAENVAYALEATGESNDVISERVFEVLTRLGIGDRADAFPHELSGGEEARAALARALIRNPSILIADEPTGNVDSVQAKAILDLLKAANADGATVILATHDTGIVASVGARLIHLEHGKIMRDTGAKKTVEAKVPVANAVSGDESRRGIVKPSEE
jgi:cell division transport system ATP-binding protein